MGFTLFLAPHSLVLFSIHTSSPGCCSSSVVKTTKHSRASICLSASGPLLFAWYFPDIQALCKLRAIFWWQFGSSISVTDHSMAASAR